MVGDDIRHYGGQTGNLGAAGLGATVRMREKQHVPDDGGHALQFFQV